MPRRSRAARNDKRILQTEFRGESLALAQEIKAHAEAIKRIYEDKAFAIKAYQTYDKQSDADLDRIYEAVKKSEKGTTCRFGSMTNLPAVARLTVDSCSPVAWAT